MHLEMLVVSLQFILVIGLLGLQTTYIVLFKVDQLSFKPELFRSTLKHRNHIYSSVEIVRHRIMRLGKSGYLLKIALMCIGAIRH